MNEVQIFYGKKNEIENVLDLVRIVYFYVVNNWLLFLFTGLFVLIVMFHMFWVGCVKFFRKLIWKDNQNNNYFQV
jgi:hypothetical protein